MTPCNARCRPLTVTHSWKRTVRESSRPPACCPPAGTIGLRAGLELILGGDCVDFSFLDVARQVDLLRRAGDRGLRRELEQANTPLLAALRAAPEEVPPARHRQIDQAFGSAAFAGRVAAALRPLLAPVSETSAKRAVDPRGGTPVLRRPSHVAPVDGGLNAAPAMLDTLARILPYLLIAVLAGNLLQRGLTKPEQPPGAAAQPRPDSARRVATLLLAGVVLATWAAVLLLQRVRAPDWTGGAAGNACHRRYLVPA